MRTPACFSSWSRRALLLVIFCALLAAPVSLAQAAPAAGSPQQPAALQSASTGDFLAALSATPAAPGSDATSTLQVPAPLFLSGCTSNDQCPTGQLCCLACGFPDCDVHACFQPVRGHCPFFP
jgi:hypothetical protein